MNKTDLYNDIKMENNICSDNRFEVIEKAKKHIIRETNIETCKDEMACLDSFLYRCWQMGWLKQYDEKQIKNKDEIVNEQLSILIKEIELLRKNLQKIMKKGLIIEGQINGTKKIKFPEPEY